MIKNKHIIKIKELIQQEVSMGTFGLVELELLAMEKEFTSQLSHNNRLSGSEQSSTHKSCNSCGVKKCIYNNNPVSDEPCCGDWEPV